jgi:hypothetical protein
MKYLRNVCAWLDEIPETTRITYINPCQLAQLLQITWSTDYDAKIITVKWTECKNRNNSNYEVT